MNNWCIFLVEVLSVQLWKFIIFCNCCFSSLFTILLRSVHIKYIIRPAILTRCWWGGGNFLFSIFFSSKAMLLIPFKFFFRKNQTKKTYQNILRFTYVIIPITCKTLLIKKNAKTWRLHCWYFFVISVSN